MPVQELENFRAKYPDYSDLSDIDLANKLAQKFPDAYGDLPSKVGQPQRHPLPMVNPQDLMPPMSGLEQFGVGMGYGMDKLLTGATQRGAQLGELIGMVPPGTAKGMEPEIIAKRQSVLPLQNRPQQVEQRPVTNIFGETRTINAPLGNPFKAGEFVGESAITAPIPGGVQGNLAKRIGTGILGGATSGAMQPTVGNESALMNAAVGGAAGGTISGAMGLGSKFMNAIFGQPMQNEAANLSRKYGVRLSLGELTNNPTVQRLETWLEQMPSIFGMRGFREKQRQESANVAKDLFSRYAIDPSLESTAAMKVANDVYLDGLYDAVRQSGAQLPRVTADNIRQVAHNLYMNFPGVFNSVQDQRIKKILTNVIGDISDIQTPVGVITPKFSFNELWELRKGIGREIGSSNNPIAEGELKALYHAVSDDMDRMFTQSGTQAGQMFRNANEEFKRVSVKFDVLREAFDAAMHTTRAGQHGEFSSQVFATQLKKLANDPKYKKHVRWEPGEVEEMNGVANILQYAKRSGQFQENPPTGNRWGLPVLLGVGIEHGGSAAFLAKGAALASMAKFLTSTKPGKKLAMSASKLEPDNPAMAKLMDQLYNQLPKMGANVAVGENPNPTPDVNDWRTYLNE